MLLDSDMEGGVVIRVEAECEAVALVKSEEGAESLASSDESDPELGEEEVTPLLLRVQLTRALSATQTCAL